MPGDVFDDDAMFDDDFESTGLEWMDAPLIGTDASMLPLDTLCDVAAEDVGDC